MNSENNSSTDIQSRKPYNIIGILLLGLLVVQPLIFSAYGIFENEFFKLLITYSVVCVMWIVIAWFRTPIYYPSKRYVLTFGLFASIYVAASLSGISPLESFIGRYGLWVHSVLSLFIFFSVLYFASIMTSYYRDAFLSYAILAIECAAILVCARSLMTATQWPWEHYETLERVSIPFRNANHLGFYLSLVFLFSFWSLLTTKDVFFRLIGIATASITFITLVMTYSRASWIAVGVSMLVGAAYFRASIMKNISYSRLMYVLIPLALLAGIVFPTAYQRIVTTFDAKQTRPSHAIRFLEWQTVLTIWQQRPWFGIGPENVDLRYPKYRDKRQNAVEEEWKWRTLTTRNYYIELLATTGPLGLAAFIGIVGTVLLVYIKERKPQIIPFAIVVVGYAVHAFLYNPNSSTQLLFYVSSGIIIGMHDVQKARIRISRVRAFTIIAVSVVLLFFIVRAGVGEWHGVQAYSYLESQEAIDHEQAYVLSERAYRWNPIFDKNARQFSLAQSVRISDMQNDSAKVNSDEKRFAIEEYVRTLQDLEARKQAGSDIENLKSLSGGYMRYAGFTNSSYEKAIDYGKRLTMLDPTSPGSWDTLGIVYLDAKQYDKALETFNHILTDLKPDYPYAFFHIGETYRQMGEPEKSIPYYEKAVALGYEGGLREIEEAKEEMKK